MDEQSIGERVAAKDPRSVRSELHSVARRQWQVMTLYERFEEIVAIILAGLISLIVLVALMQLIMVVFTLLVTQTLNPLEHETFQLVFGMIMTVLIALEFKHSIIRVALRRGSIIQVKTVVLIALIALARKFVILDVETSPSKIAALAAALLALGAVYWLIRERDEREARQQQERGEAAPGRMDHPAG